MLMFASQNLITGTASTTLVTTITTLVNKGYLSADAANRLVVALADAGYGTTVPLASLQNIGTNMVAKGRITADALNRIIAGT